jgi:hypothetical protein
MRVGDKGRHGERAEIQHRRRNLATHTGQTLQLSKRLRHREITEIVDIEIGVAPFEDLQDRDKAVGLIIRPGYVVQLRFDLEQGCSHQFAQTAKAMHETSISRVRNDIAGSDAKHGADELRRGLKPLDRQRESAKRRSQ